MSVAPPAGHSSGGEVGIANAAIADQVGSQGSALSMGLLVQRLGRRIVSRRPLQATSAHSFALTKGGNMTLTKSMVYATGRDAGNRSMKAAGRTWWNEDDFNAAAAECARLMKFLRAN